MDLAERTGRVSARASHPAQGTRRPQLIGPGEVVMAGITADGTEAGPDARARGRRRAAGIYGAIITAAILAAVGSQIPTPALAVSVVVTLLVYWIAEEYAEVLGEQATGGHLPTWASIRAMLATTWPMVTAS